MSGFIMDFLNGKIEPQDRPWKDSLEWDRILTALDENETFLQNNLNGEASERLKAYIAAWDENLGNVDDAAFLKGFRLGARCMLDILQE